MLKIDVRICLKKKIIKEYKKDKFKIWLKKANKKINITSENTKKKQFLKCGEENKRKQQL